MIPLYLRPRFTSRRANFNASSTIQRTPSSPDASIFSRAHDTTGFTESTCVTDAPALPAASVAPPVYANRFSTCTAPETFSPGRPATATANPGFPFPADVSATLCTCPAMNSQFAACSGKIPTCLKAVRPSRNFKSIASLR